MLDRKTMRLLRRFYRRKFISLAEVKPLTGNIPDNRRNPYIEKLLSARLISVVSDGISSDGFSVLVGYEITLDGAAFVQDQRRRTWGFVVPYAITTLLALASLSTQVAANWDRILDWLQ